MTEVEHAVVDTGDAVIDVDFCGSGPAVLLLHGFPETKLMWREIAPRLAERFFVVCADLRGYGGSGTPPSSADHLPYSKRVMAAEMVAVMHRLGQDRFGIVGHDRGGRVAYRAALDHPMTITKLAVLDVLPVDTVWDESDARMALGFWPWSLLAQPEPFPERLIGAAPDAVVDNALGPAWGTPAETFTGPVREDYMRQLRDPAHVHAICEEYRAAAEIDREHDAADRRERHRISCPVLALWSASGPLSEWYTRLGGPLAIWNGLAGDVTGGPVEGGHFFPEEYPQRTAAALTEFLSA